MRLAAPFGGEFEVEPNLDDVGGSMRLPLLTFIATIATALVTYSITVTLAYARLDKDLALERQARESLERRVLTIEQIRDERTQTINDLWQQIQDISGNLDYLNRQLSPEVGNYHIQRSPERRK